MLKAAIQFPIQTPASFEVVNRAFQRLASRYILGHSRMQHPLSFRLVPQGPNFFGEIWVPLNGRSEIENALELFTGLNQIYLKAHSNEPELYKAGIRYGLGNKLAWFTAPLLLDKKVGDCKDLCAYRAAWLREHGEPGARCHLKYVGPRQWHVQLQRQSGAIEDPSVKLGMHEWARRNR